MFPRKFIFAGHVAASQALDTCASNLSRRYSGLGVHAIIIKARALFPAIDHVSEFRQPRLNQTIMRSWGNTWTHLNATMAIERRKPNSREIVAHDLYTIVAYNHCAIVAINRLSPYQMARVSRGNSSLKTDVFSLLLLTFDQIVKQLSDF